MPSMRSNAQGSPPDNAGASTSSKQEQGSPFSDAKPQSGAGKNNKRKRVSRACDQCFSKKDRCDGAIPICDFCAQQGRTCTYDRPERKRGPTQGLRPKLENRIADLEALLGLIVRLEPGAQHAVKEHLRTLQQGKSATDERTKAGWRHAWFESSLRNDTLAEKNRARNRNIWFGSFEEDLVSTSNIIPSADATSFATLPTNPQQGAATQAPSHVPTLDQYQQHHQQSQAQEQEDDESDYSEVDLSLPPGTHPLSTSIAAQQRRRRQQRQQRRGRRGNSFSQGSHYSDDDEEDGGGDDGDSYTSSQYLDDHHHDDGDGVDGGGTGDDGYSSHHRRKRTRSPILPLLSSGRGGSSLNRGLVPKGTDPNAALGGFEIAFGGNEHDEHWVRDFVPPGRSPDASATNNRHK